MTQPPYPPPPHQGWGSATPPGAAYPPGQWAGPPAVPAKGGVAAWLIIVAISLVAGVGAGVAFQVTGLFEGARATAAAGRGTGAAAPPVLDGAGQAGSFSRADLPGRWAPDCESGSYLILDESGGFELDGSRGDWEFDAAARTMTLSEGGGARTVIDIVSLDANQMVARAGAAAARSFQRCE